MINRRNPCKANILIETPKDIFRRGFTLIEISIVLVIIGLIVGGILVGQDLIASAAIRAQISQIEKYNTAVHTFQGKYGYLPGDMPQNAVTQFGFTVATTRSGRGNNGSAGDGNGDGILEGSLYGSGSSDVGFAQGGETFWFWEDLSTNSGLIGDTFNTATNAATNPNPIYGMTAINQYIPLGKISYSTFIMVGSINGVNYYVLSPLGNFGGGCSPAPCISNGSTSTYFVGVPAKLAYAIDQKIDDGLPASGSVEFVSVYAGNIVLLGTAGTYASACFNTATNQYLASNTAYCAMAFKFQ